MANGFYFNDLEALKISIDIERRGERFYRAAASKMADKGIIQMLLELAEQEKEHADVFEGLYDEAASKKENFDDTYLFEPEISAYISAIVKTTVFPSDEKLDKTLEKINTIEDVLRLGIQAEKDSILFYTEMIIYSKLHEAKVAFRKLLQEEKKHLIDLQNQLNI